MMQDFDIARNDMVDRQLIPRGVKTPAVLDAMRNVPRHLFVPENMQRSAYDDSPLPIGSGQTISQPYIVAYMTEQLNPRPGMKVLEIGTGSGYQAAVLVYMGCDVYTMELLEAHANRAREDITSYIAQSDAVIFGTVTVKHGNGYLGWPEEAPYDAIIVTAAPETIPDALVKQLKDGGKMIIPVGGIHEVQSLVLITKRGEGIIKEDLLPVRFVPMVDK